MYTTTDIRYMLQQSPKVPQNSAKMFFKTAKGQYAEHDVFLGIRVPHLRKIAASLGNLSWNVMQDLIQSPIHEERFLLLLVMVRQYHHTTDYAQKNALYTFYRQHLYGVNNWDLVDASAHLIIGAHLWNKEHDLLYSLAQSASMWERRIAIVATWFFIKKEHIATTYTLAHMLFHDSHDLVHKAVGWMLREAGKRDITQLRVFLAQHAQDMPRTMLRYSIEKFSKEERSAYVQKK